MFPRPFYSTAGRSRQPVYREKEAVKTTWSQITPVGSVPPGGMPVQLRIAGRFLEELVQKLLLIVKTGVLDTVEGLGEI